MPWNLQQEHTHKKLKRDKGKHVFGFIYFPSFSFVMKVFWRLKLARACQSAERVWDWRASGLENNRKQSRKGKAAKRNLCIIFAFMLISRNCLNMEHVWTVQDPAVSNIILAVEFLTGFILTTWHGDMASRDWLDFWVLRSGANQASEEVCLGQGRPRLSGLSVSAMVIPSTSEPC